MVSRKFVKRNIVTKYFCKEGCHDKVVSGKFIKQRKFKGTEIMLFS